MKLLVFCCLLATGFAARQPSFTSSRLNPGFAPFGAPVQKPSFPQRASVVPARAPQPSAVLARIPQPSPQRVVSPNGDVQILRYDNDNIGTGNYQYGVDQSDGTKFQAQGELKNEGREDEYIVVKGSFEWIGADGVKYTATYVADDNGYRPQYEQGPGGNIPPEIIARLLAK